MKEEANTKKESFDPVSMFGALKNITKPSGMEKIERPKKTFSERKKHTFEITESIYQDFKLLTKVEEMNVNDAIDKLIAKEVGKNKEFIEELKKRRGI